MSAPITDLKYFDAIYDLLPSKLKAGIDDLLGGVTRESTARNTLDQLIQFSLGQSISNGDNAELCREWELQLPKAQLALRALQSPVEKGKKRDRDDDVVSASEANPTKKIKRDFEDIEDGEDTPLYTLHALSAASPIRKKVNIAIYQKSIRFINPISEVQEMSIPLKSVSRAFLISTPGKSKPHWTVVILADTDANQVIFGLDAIPPSLMTTAHPAPPKSNPKGSEAKPAVNAFLSHLPPHVPVLESSTSQLRSGEPYHIDAYLRAKDGQLLFFKEGIFFGLKKPCIWIGMNNIENVRTLSATGRAFSLFVKRVDSMKGEEEVEGEETAFSMIDGKHQDSVSQWIHDNKTRFGASDAESPKNIPGENGAAVAEPATQGEIVDKQNDEDSGDLEDEDYQDESESNTGSASADSSEGEGDDSGDEGEEEQDSDGEAGGDEDAKEDILDPEKHPLMAPGAVPRLSKAAINAVIGMVEQDLMGASGSPRDEVEGNEDYEVEYDSEDVDELE